MLKIAAIARAAKLGILGTGLALVIEVVSVLAWVSAHAEAPRLSIAVLGHALSSVLLAFSFPSLLPKAYRIPVWGTRIFLLNVAMFIPAIGALGLVITLLIALYLPKQHVEIAYDLIDVPELPHRTVRHSEVSARFGEGAIEGVLRHVQDPEVRLAAVMAIRQMKEELAVPLLRIALKDPVDDVRLLAYAMLYGKEQGVYDRIQKATQSLQAAAEEDRLAIHKALANDYWELAYLGLAAGDVLAFALDSSEKHARIALELQEETSTARLLGRVLLRQRKFAEARASFSRANALGLPDETIRPYLAEIAFMERKFEEVRLHLLALDPRSLRRPPLDGIARYWLGENP